MNFTENRFEQAVIELFQTHLGYDYFYGPDVERDYRDCLFMDQLTVSLERINPKLPSSAIQSAVNKLRDLDSGTLLQKNMTFMKYLQEGIHVSYLKGGEEVSGIVYLVDYDNISSNSFIVANQWTIQEHSEKRPDIVIFLNGLPVVVFELKSPTREETEASEAYAQLRNYMHEIPSLFYYNAFLVMSDMATSKLGTITADEGRFMEWKTKDGNYEDTQFANFDTLIEGVFVKDRLLDIIKNFICFSDDAKILAAYHQYFAVRKANQTTLSAIGNDGRAGVFWHTQGSGKSLSMVFYAHLLQTSVNSPTIVVLTDRNDLDNQLYKQFIKCERFLGQTPVQAKSRQDLKDLLNGRKANGIFFSTMQKFEETNGPLSTRQNIIVMADEAHRGQYGLTERISTDGKVSIGSARIIRNNLPNATYIGFTGTPISAKDKSTTEVFGNYIDVYDMTQAVEDGATKPVYYESRVIHLKLEESVLQQIDAAYDAIAEEVEEYTITKSKQEMSRLDSILGSEQSINTLVKDILDHYENNRQYEQTGKAMIVAYSRQGAMKIYHKLLELRPAWSEKIGIVMTSSNKDPEEWHAIIGNKKHKEEMEKKFKDDDSPFKIAIVVDMWLTGFDVPSLSTMYVFKPMKGHNLMQAIARVNRVYKDKAGGLVVDYIGIAPALRQAMNEYSHRDKYNYGDTDIAKTAYPKFQEKLGVCTDLFYGFDFSQFGNPDATDLQRAQLIKGGVNFISDRSKEENKKLFLKEATVLRQSAQLCRSMLSPRERFEAGYFEAVRITLTRLLNPKKPLSLKQINEQINELLKSSVKSEGVINLFADSNKDFSLFDPQFLEGISRMKEKNIAVEILKKLLKEQVRIYKRKNIVQSDKFSEMLSRSMNAYLNGMLTNEEVIQELIKMATEMSQSNGLANELGLTEEELAFYDAITKPEAVRDFYENTELVSLTHELTELLRKNRTIDWQKKESARAKMRTLVKRLLNKYKYPPEGLEDAVSTVMNQCELWVDSGIYSF